MRRRASALAVAAAMCAACSAPAAPTTDTTSRSAPVALVSRTAEQIVRELQRQGFDVDHPAEATDTSCADAGCTQAVVTDRFRLLAFPTTGAAQTYAATRGMRQIETVAVSFAPVVPAGERDRYWAAIVRLIR